jgi:hypothetical protein
MSTELIFDEDLGFDGLALKLKGRLGSSVTPFLTAGAFPIFNTDFNFSSNQPAKFESTDKYLFAVQGGADIRLSDDLKVKLGIAYYDFDGVQGLTRCAVRHILRYRYVESPRRFDLSREGPNDRWLKPQSGHPALRGLPHLLPSLPGHERQAKREARCRLLRLP